MRAINFVPVKKLKTWGQADGKARPADVLRPVLAECPYCGDEFPTKWSFETGLLRTCCFACAVEGRRGEGVAWQD